jgi:LPXTG-motif cell wall-anchored protein
MEGVIIQVSEVLTNNVPYIVLVGALLVGLLILLSLRRRKEENETAKCPHCYGEIDPDSVECRHCNRKVSNQGRGRRR